MLIYVLIPALTSYPNAGPKPYTNPFNNTRGLIMTHILLHTLIPQHYPILNHSLIQFIPHIPIRTPIHIFTHIITYILPHILIRIPIRILTHILMPILTHILRWILIHVPIPTCVLTLSLLPLPNHYHHTYLYPPHAPPRPSHSYPSTQASSTCTSLKHISTFVPSHRCCSGSSYTPRQCQ